MDETGATTRQVPNVVRTEAERAKTTGEKEIIFKLIVNFIKQPLFGVWCCYYYIICSIAIDPTRTEKRGINMSPPCRHANNRRWLDCSASSFLLVALYCSWLLVDVTGLAQNNAARENGVFPTSMRQALVQKSQRLNPTSYGPSGLWSNRAATALTPVHPDGIYTADRPFYWNNIDVSCRCTIIELPPTQAAADNKRQKQPKNLWVHSPVTLDAPLLSALQMVVNDDDNNSNNNNSKNDANNVNYYIVSPNYEHVKYAPQWQIALGDQAQMIACPGLSQRLPNQIDWTAEIPNHYRPVSWTGSSSQTTTTNLPWDDTILEALHIDCEVNPFTGKPFFNEVIFYHTPTKALIVTDLFWNYPAANEAPNAQLLGRQDDEWELAPRQPVPWGSKAWKFGMDRVYAPFYNNFMIADRTAYRDIVHHILNVWDVEMVIPAHGDILRGKEFIREVLKKHFGVMH